MPRIVIDKSLQRVVQDGFTFPLGVFPVETMKPRSGYVVEFEAADGGGGAESDPEAGADEALAGGQPDVEIPEPEAEETGATINPSDDWEEWPDRFMYDVLIGADRLPALCRILFSILPSRVYPILDVMGHDDYREIDPYIAYDLVGMEKFYDALRSFGDWLFEDGMVGFGAMSVEPFFYVFVDEHKAVTIRAQLDLKEKVERILAAFDLEAVPDILGADSAAHEHRTILVSPEAESDSLTADDILDRLREQWLLQLNIDARANVDDEGKPLGITGWRCLLRCTSDKEDELESYAEVLLSADCLETAERLATEAVGEPKRGGAWASIEPLNCDRLLPERFAEALGKPAAKITAANQVHSVRWLENDKPE